MEPPRTPWGHYFCLPPGTRRSPQGLFFPFFVIEWIEGTPLYEWTRQQPPSTAQRAQALAQRARALQATHDCFAVHRDVKGDNVLVRHSDGRAMLMGFGAGNYPSAARSTSQSLAAEGGGLSPSAPHPVPAGADMTAGPGGYHARP